MVRRTYPWEGRTSECRRDATAFLGDFAELPDKNAGLLV